MKIVRRLENPTDGLARYLSNAGEKADWKKFRRHMHGKSIKELGSALLEEQHGICGYCEIGIDDSNRQIEHVVPQTDPRRGAALTFDSRNMMACCLGGTRRGDDPARFRQPVRFNMSCGQRKSDRTLPNFVDPRILSAAPSLTRVTPDGRIAPDQAACADAGFTANNVRDTIDFLGLNVERLRVAREDLWRRLDRDWRDSVDNDTLMRTAAREALGLTRGKLPVFFTTVRSWFGHWAEEILLEPPQDWI